MFQQPLALLSLKRYPQRILILFAALLSLIVFGDVPWFSTLLGLSTSAYFLILYLKNIQSLHMKEIQAIQTGHQLESQRQLSEQLQLKQMLELSNAEKQRFLAALSHDMRQPIHALSLYSANLQHHAQQVNFAAVSQTAAQIQGCLGWLNELFSSLIELSRAAQLTPSSLSNISLNDLFRQLNTRFQATALKQQCSLVFAKNHFFLHTDGKLLEQLLSKLIANALRFSPNGRVLVLARTRAKKLWIEVRDNGVGIPETMHAQIFDDFFQCTHQIHDAQPSLGVGLGIARRIATQLGGEIDVTSNPGCGSTFRLQISGLVSPLDQKPLDTGLRSSPQCIGLFGIDPELKDITTFLTEWGYNSRYVQDLPELANANLSLQVLITDVSPADIQPNLSDTPVIFIASNQATKPNHPFILETPVRPARLRALLIRLLNPAI